MTGLNRLCRSGSQGKYILRQHRVSLFTCYPMQAAFDPRVLATFCWFATEYVHPSQPASCPSAESSLLISVHSATLGKGQSDDTLIKIRNGDMDGKGEVTLVFGKQVSGVISFSKRLGPDGGTICAIGHPCAEGGTRPNPQDPGRP